MVVLVAPTLYQNPEMKWFVCSVIEEAFHTQGLFPNSYPPKKSIGHLSPHWDSIPGNNHTNPFQHIMNLKQHSRSKNCVFGGDEVSQLVHDQLALLTRDSQCPGIEQLRIGRLATFEQGKTWCKGLKSQEDKARAVQQKVARSKRCLRHNRKEQVMHRVHRWGSVGQGSFFFRIADHLSLSFNTALRQVIIEEDLQTLDTVVAVQRGD